ncbi:MAG: hypothetical protein ACRDB0_01345 [Paraclostridium sp.]
MRRFDLFKALTGSHNYNLNRPDSDLDYKIFIVPSFDDLYYNMYCHKKAEHSELIDYDYHDVRNLIYRLSKSNVNFIEVLFSEEIIINPELPVWAKYAISELMSMKKDIAKMNLPYLFDACLGMKHNKLKLIDKGSGSSIQYVKKHGYDTKSAMNAYRILDFLERFAKTEFNDFKSAIWYTDKEKTMLNAILNGSFTKEEVVNIIKQKEQFIKDNYKDLYKAHELNEETYNRLEKIVKNLVKHSIILYKENN